MMIVVDHCMECGAVIYGSPHTNIDEPLSTVLFTTCHCEENSSNYLYQSGIDGEYNIIGSGDFAGWEAGR